MSKRISYIMPVEWVRGSLSGAQTLTYGGVQAYDVSTTDKISADSYRPTLVAKRLSRNGRLFYQVRTRTSVHLSTLARMNLAVLGGAGAIFSALVNRGDNVHRYLTFPVLMDMLRTKANGAQCEGIAVDNPWRVQNPNVSIAPAIISKFNNELS